MDQFYSGVVAIRYVIYSTSRFVNNIMFSYNGSYTSGMNFATKTCRPTRQAYNLRIGLVHAAACTRPEQTLDCKRWTSLLSAAIGRGGIAHCGRSRISAIALFID